MGPNEEFLYESQLSAMKSRKQGRGAESENHKELRVFQTACHSYILGRSHSLAKLKKRKGLWEFRKSLYDAKSCNKKNLIALKMIQLHSEMTRIPSVEGLDSQDVQNMQVLAHRGSQNH